MIDVLGLGQIGDAEQILSLEIGDDDGVALGQDLLGLGDDVAILRHDVLDQLVVLAEEGAAPIVVLDGETRALDAVVGEHLVDERQGHRLVIGFAEIMDFDIDRGRRALGRGGWASPQAAAHRQRRRCRGEEARATAPRRRTPDASRWSRCRKRTGTHSALSIQSYGQCLLFREGTAKVSRSRTSRVEGLRSLVGKERLADRASATVSRLHRQKTQGLGQKSPPRCLRYFDVRWRACRRRGCRRRGRRSRSGAPRRQVRRDSRRSRDRWRTAN